MIPSHYPLMLATGSTSAESRLDVVSPYSGDLLSRVDQANAAQVEEALAVAHKLFRNKKGWLNVAKRVGILDKAAALMEQRFDMLAEVAASEGGKPLVDTRVEVHRAIDGVRLCAETLRSEAGEVVPMTELDPQFSRMAFTQREPIGVVVAVSAFNHPLNLIVHQVGAAVAAGCPTLVKPANITPLSCLEFVSILHESGLPQEWCQVVLPVDRKLATAMVVDGRVGFFSFIGSAAVGWSLRSQLAPGTRCALEHGGVAPVIVDESASLDKLIPAILKGGYYHAGQVCVSVQRLFVHASLFDETAERLTAGICELKVGDSLSADTEVGPLIKPAEVKRVDEWVEEAVAAGAHKPVGGGMLANNCYSPTLLLNPPADSRVSCEEIFGPVVCQYGYQNLDSAIEQANSLPFAFQAAVFAQDLDRAVDIYHKLDASAVMVNDHTAFRQDAMPFAGLRHSGYGVGGIPHTIQDMQIEKMMVIKAKRS